MEKLKRYIIFLIGLFINSLGVSLITKADLGTSPISAIPYVLSLNFPLTLGQFTIIFSILLILIQLCILRKNFKPEHFLQIPISILFGYFIDLTMILLGFVNPQTYPVKVISLLIGCVILGFGVYTEVLANVAMLPGESFVRAVSSTWKTEFGITKISFDVSLTVIAGVLSFLFSGRLHGVREGTIIAALLVGFLARLFGRALHFLEPALFGAEGRARKSAQSTAEQPCPSDAQDSSDSGETAAAAAARGQLTGNPQDSPDISEGNRQNGKAPVEYRIRRIMVTEELSEQAARQKIQQMDRRRADNYHYYTHQMWGHSKNYDLTVSTELGQETVAEIIQRALLSF
ncbi:MAG TPA: cytidylate kinase family protein [Candidatus Mediterraneibacter cottocaccae]|nr:cytidylate kinase family protein [Candidatus Mediterraneibacter cottocaccae]